MTKTKFKFLTLGALFAVCGCQLTSNSTPITSNGGTQTSSSTTTLNEYTVTWVVDGTVTEETYLEGATPVYKYGTEKDSDEVYTYTFIGWDKEIVPVVADITYTAVYEQDYIDYVVTWVVDGTETKDTYHYGDLPTYDGTPTKEGDAQYSYTFTGWDKEVVAVTQNETYTAQFEESINEYEVTWVVDGVETKETYMYGDIPSYDGTPTKEGDAQYTFTFTGWDKEIAEVTEDVTYTATFERNVNEYTITWVVGGEKITESYEYGATPEFKGSTDRESSKYTYTFKGWEPAVDVVDGDQTYVAQYDEVINKFVVNFFSEDGDLLQTSEVEYDGIPVYTGEIPTKAPEGEFLYSFAGWENRETGLVYNGTLPSILGAVNYYAKFDKQGKPYDLTYNLLNLDGSLIETKTTQFGYQSIYTLEAPAVEGKVANKDYVKGYMEKENAPIDIYYSEVNVWDGETVSTSLEGEGTEANPYLISSGADLAYIRKQINESTKEAPVTFAGQYFKLTKSIDLNDVENFRIGTSDKITFGGHLDGNNCSIRGININMTTTRAALFYAVLEGGSISNLSTYGTAKGGQYASVLTGRTFGLISNVSNFAKLSHSGGNGCGPVAGGISGVNALVDNCVNYADVVNEAKNNKTGGVAGACERGRITNCTNYGNLEGNHMTAGVLGEAQVTFTLVENCVNYGNVSFTQGGGGVMGASYVEVNNCVNYGAVTSRNNTNVEASYHTGGIIGSTKQNVVTGCVNYGIVTGGSRCGGISGHNGNAGFELTFVDCVNYGKVISNHTTDSYLGGILGAADQIVNLENCVNNGDVEADKRWVGGIIGVICANGFITVTKCVNNGNIKSNGNGVGGICGGGVSENSTLNVYNCTNNGNITGNDRIGGIMGLHRKGEIAEDNVNNGVITATSSEPLYANPIIGDDQRVN